MNVHQKGKLQEAKHKLCDTRAHIAWVTALKLYISIDEYNILHITHGLVDNFEGQ